jgi:hypothetical protein
VVLRGDTPRARQAGCRCRVRFERPPRRRGLADPGRLPAPPLGCLPTNAQRSGHGGPPPRPPVSGPRRTVGSDGRPADGGRADPDWFSAHRDGGLPTNAQRAATEVRAPAVLVLLAVTGSWFARLAPSPQTNFRPNGPAVPPARPSGPGKVPPTTSFAGPTGQPFVFVSRAVRGSVGPLGLTERNWTRPGVGNMYLSPFISPHELNSRVTPSPIVVVFDHGFEFRDFVSQLSGLSDDVRHLRHSAVEIVARSADSSKPIARQLARHGHFALPRWKIAEIVLPTCSRSTGVGVIPTAKNGCKARV